MSFPAYGGIKEIAPMAKTRQTNPLFHQLDNAQSKVKGIS